MRPEHADRLISKLEDQLADETDPAERKAILDEIREIQRDLAEHEQWQDQGRDRGWT